MQNNHLAIIAECLDCGQQTPFHPSISACPACGGQWLEARYDYNAIGKELLSLVKHRPFDLWRYRELLPVTGFLPDLSMGEGGTPLIHAINLGTMLGCPNLYIKDERQGPTASFKDRQAAVSVAALKQADICEVVLSSTGNVAIAYSAYAARAGIKLWAFLTSLVPAEKMRETALYGTQVIKVTASYDQAKKIAAEFAQQRGLFQERGARSIPSVEGMKTIAYEIAEQLEDRLPPVDEQNDDSPQPRWVAPDWYFQAVSGGLGPLGVQKGFNELLQMGLIAREPKIAAIQTEGCAPMVHAWRAGREEAEPVTVPQTRIATLSTGDPGRTYTLLCQRMQQAAGRQQDGLFPTTPENIRGGVFEYVSDEESFRMMHILAKLEGLSVEPASAVAFAGLVKLLREGVVDPEDVIVVNCTGHTISIENSILGDGWGRDVSLPGQSQESEAAGTGVSASSEQEGLLAALSQVTEDRFSRVLIVDDHEEPRRLLRRILQSQGSFAFSEANDGWQAIEQARSQLPDLILLDLMMPGMDGFSVLDALKAEPATASIPVIVVTAKTLTLDEKQRLEGRISTLMQKGEFLSDDLLREVQMLLE